MGKRTSACYKSGSGNFCDLIKDPEEAVEDG